MPKRLCGLLGGHVDHSLSPRLHALAAIACGVELAYLPFSLPEEDLPAAIEGLRVLGAVGANVTVPHKEAVLPLVDELSDEVRAIGAANTIVFDSQRRARAANTDHLGFGRALREVGWQPEGARVIVWGAGGAARAAVYALVKMGVEAIAIAARNPLQAERLIGDLAPHGAAELRSLPWSEGFTEELLAGQTLLVNTTPLGGGEAGTLPLPEGLTLSPQTLVYDLLYRPEATLLPRWAEAAGAGFLNGLPMLVYQAWAAFELWTGHTPPPELSPDRIATLFAAMRGFPPPPAPPVVEAPARAIAPWARLGEGLARPRIVLTGFMGAGKSTLGARLAEQLGWSFLDLDTLIVEHTGLTIPQIFAEQGELAFRELERKLFAAVAARDRVVLALGGGAWLQPEIFDLARESALTIWLDASPEELRRRLASDTNRPLAARGHFPAELLAARVPAYRRAHLHLDAELSLEVLVELVRHALRPSATSLLFTEGM